MRRGFKAEAERISLDARIALGVDPFMRIDPWAYATHLGVLVLDFHTLDLPAASKHQLLVADPDSWSGMTLKDGEVFAIVINPVHSRARQCSTLVHELAHVILRHVPARVDVSKSGLLLLSDYSDEHEGEADWLAAAILLPRDALIRHRHAGGSAASIAADFGVSEQLCEWRLRMTGVDAQMKRSYAKRS